MRELRTSSLWLIALAWSWLVAAASAQAVIDDATTGTLDAGGFRLAEPRSLVALAIVPALALLAWWSWARVRWLAERFVASRAWHRVLDRRPRAAPVQLALLVGAVACLSVALARPQWNPRAIDVERRGRDVAFVLDVSRSMLATDLAPNRLQRAKLWVRDLVSTLDGDRVALVAFAGGTTVLSPLTTDYAFFGIALDELSPASAGRGGTLIGDAIRTTVADVFGAQEGDHRLRDIILFTDGGDQESFPVEAAAEAARAGVRIIAIGLGGEGAVVPGVTEGDQPVLSRLDAQSLQQVALASNGGVMINVGTGTIELERVYAQLVKAAEQQTVQTRRAMRYSEGFQIMLAGALVLLVARELVARGEGGGA